MGPKRKMKGQELYDDDYEPPKKKEKPETRAQIVNGQWIGADPPLGLLRGDTRRVGMHETNCAEESSKARD